MSLEREVLKKLDIDAINAAMNLIMEAYTAKKKIYIFGNGGSSATASHYQNDFNKGLSEYVDHKIQLYLLERQCRNSDGDCQRYRLRGGIPFSA